MRIKLDRDMITIENNKVNLCDSCRKTFPDCGAVEVLFGDGTGEDNICCCRKYTPGEKHG